jgi:nucleoid-associated protein YgaU
MKRINAISVVIIIVLAVSALSTFALGARARGEVMIKYKDYRVKSGDTLWAVAQKYISENQDIRKYIDRIMKENGMETPALFPGQILHIPVE